MGRLEGKWTLTCRAYDGHDEVRHPEYKTHQRPHFHLHDYHQQRRSTINNSHSLLYNHFYLSKSFVFHLYLIITIISTMQLSAFLTLTGLAATSLAAPAYTDPTVCAPGTGYYQVCSWNGFKGCSTKDECTPPSNPTTVPGTNPDGTCQPGYGYYQVCAWNGFKGCSTKDECTPPPGYYGKRAAAYNDPTVCAPGTGYYQVCAWNGFKGCSTKDECTPPSNPTTVPGTNPDGTCQPGYGYYQVCAWNGFKGCSTEDECTPPAGHYVKRAAAYNDPTVCAPGTGYYQVCAWNGFKGCSTKDECSPPSAPTTVPGTNPDGTCQPGYGYYQVCANGFKGCSVKDECSRH
jgi:hypothetical protein